MKKIILFFAICLSFILTTQPINAQETSKQVYVEIVGKATNVLGINSNCKVTVDFGQYQSGFKEYTIQDENGKDIKFSSMVDALNYMGERGWKFIQAYVINHNNQNVYHYLLYKDVTNKDEILEGLNIKK